MCGYFQGVLTLAGDMTFDLEQNPSEFASKEVGIKGVRVPWMAWHQEGVIVTLDDLEKMDEGRLFKFHRDLILKAQSILNRIALLEGTGDRDSGYVLEQLQKARKAHLSCMDFLRETAPRVQDFQKRLAESLQSANEVIDAKRGEFLHNAFRQKVAEVLEDVLGRERGSSLLCELEQGAEREGSERFERWANESQANYLDSLENSFFPIQDGTLSGRPR